MVASLQCEDTSIESISVDINRNTRQIEEIFALDPGQVADDQQTAVRGITGDTAFNFSVNVKPTFKMQVSLDCRTLANERIYLILHIFFSISFVIEHDLHLTREWPIQTAPTN